MIWNQRFDTSTKKSRKKQRMILPKQIKIKLIHINEQKFVRINQNRDFHTYFEKTRRDEAVILFALN